MGLLSGSSSFRRFRTVQPLPNDFRESFVDSVNRYAFRENPGHRFKEPLIGWANIFNPDDTDFTLNTFLYDHYIVLTMRSDKKTVNGRFLNIQLERRYREVMNERHLTRLGKQHKAEIKEALEEELLAKALPAVSTYDVVWDINSGEVFVFATTDAAVDYVHGLLHDTFGIIVHPERMVDWLAERWDWETIEALVDAHVPGGVAERQVPLDVDGWHTGNPLKGREHRLGAEFLTWLWYQSESHDGLFKLEEPAGTSSGDEAPIEQGGASEEIPEITLWLDNKVIFRELDDGDEPGVTTMVGEAPSATPEAKLSLRSGKLPVEARVGFQRGSHQWFLTIGLGTTGLELKNLKLPIEVKDGEEERVYERMYLIEVLTGTVKTLFRRFFAFRTGDAWPGVIDAWLEENGVSG